MKRSTKKIPTPKKTKRWCILFGFKRDNHSETGCLAFRSNDEIKANPRSGIYKIVESASEAKHFPCENYDNIQGFASPEKWLEFFSSEPELKDWKFHLVKRTSTNEKNLLSENQEEQLEKEDKICG